MSIFIMVLSSFLLADMILETEFIQNTVAHLEESENTVMDFSGATIGVSLAITALPDDFATPLASTISDMNGYFVVDLDSLIKASIIDDKEVEFR